MATKANLPPILYHYTTTKGLLGIIESRSLFATDLFYMNDSAEVDYSLGVVRKVIRKLNDHFPDATRPAIERLKEIFEVIPRVHESSLNCVACFCTKGDLLSQWRGYAQSEGFAIGFDTQALGGEKLFWQVIYRRQEQEAKVIDLLRPALEEATQLHVSREIDEVIVPAAAGLITAMETFKSDAFKSEREWRILLPLNDSHSKQFLFRESNLGVVPYAKIAIGEGESSAISKIIIGPTAHRREARRAIDALLRSASLSNVEVTLSKIPLRA